MKSGSLMISLNYGVKNFNSENYIADSQICFLSSTRMIKCIDRIMAYCNSYCFGLWKVWLKIQSTALHSRSLYCRNCVFKKKKNELGLLFYIFAINWHTWFKQVKDFLLISRLNLNIDSYIWWSFYCYFKDRCWVNNLI